MKKISIIIPVKNEEVFISDCIDSILMSTYPRKLIELIIVDGMSSDKTIEIVNTYIKKYDFIRLLENHGKIVPIGLNIGIKESTGDYIIRLDAHSKYPPDYFEKLIYWIEKLNADNVGGIIDTKESENNLIARVISLILSNKFGVGDSQFRIGVGKPREVDTVPFGCFRRELFDKIGLFDERLERNQDIEFNKRIIKNGGSIYLIPEIRATYFARSSFPAMWKNSIKTGKWIIQTSYLTKTFSSLSLRHFIPSIFVIYLLLLFFNSYLLFFIPLYLYILLDLYFSISISIREKNILFMPFLTFGFFSLHITYGIGSFLGIAKVIIAHFFNKNL